MKQNQNTPEDQLNNFLDMISTVGDRAMKKVLKQNGVDNVEDVRLQNKGRSNELYSSFRESAINSLIKEGKAQSREEAVQMLEEMS